MSMKFSRQGYWSEVSFPNPEDLLDPEIKPASLVTPSLANVFFTTEPPGKSHFYERGTQIVKRTGSYLVSFHSNPKERQCQRMLKLPHSCTHHTIALISHDSKVMLKILQARLEQYMNRELTDVQAAFRKGRGTRDQIANICWIIKKAGEFQKNI